MDAWEFGRSLRGWRERMTPAAVGLTAGSRRRAPGLRREELAQLAGISADYLTRLEQGRATSPSAQVVESLSRALRLADAERELLYRLARLAAPGKEMVPSHVPASVQRILDRLANTPVAVYDATMTLIVANAPYDALMGATAQLSGLERNAVWRNLIGPGSRAIQTPEEQADLESRLVADLRLTFARYPTDRGVRRLVDELAAESPRFVELWETNDSGQVTGPSRTKTIAHPAVGTITVDCDTLIVSADDLRVMVYTAEPGSSDAERLALAIVLGTQTLVE